MSGAMLYTVEGRSREPANWVANLNHFALSEGQAVSSQQVIDEPNWTPYSIQHDTRSVVFVELPPEINLNDEVFVYQTQYDLAKRALVVPYDDLEALAAQITPPENVIFIMSLPRSGTTLVSKMFGSIDDVWSLSEPDIYTRLGFLTSMGAIDPADADLLNRVGTRLLFRPHGTHQNARTLVIKPRSQGLFTVESIYRVFPDAKYLFLYREGLAFAESFYSFMSKLGLIEMVEVLATSLVWQTMTTHPTTQYLSEMLQRPLDGSPEGIRFAEFTAGLFAAQCEHYIKTVEAGIPYLAIRYNELNQAREREVAAMIDHCGLPESTLECMLTAFERDSQAGTVISREVEGEAMTAAQKATFCETLAKHPRLNDVNIRLPDVRHPHIGTWDAAD